MGIAKEDIFILRSGDVLECGEDFCGVIEKAPAGGVYVDGLSVGDVGNSVLRDRQHLSEDGIVVASLVVDAYSGALLSGPDLVSRGVSFGTDGDVLMDEARTVVTEAVTNAFDKGINDWGKIKSIVKDTLNEFFWKKYKRRPMILPIIMDV